jgi:Signal transduction histidine kinase
MWRRASTSRQLMMLVCGAYLLAFLLLAAGIYATVSARMRTDTRAFVDASAEELHSLYRALGRQALLEYVVDGSRDTDRTFMVYSMFDGQGRTLAGRVLPASVAAAGPGWQRFRIRGGPQIEAQVIRLSGGEYLLVGLEMRAGEWFLDTMARAAGLALLIAPVLALAMGWAISGWIGHRLSVLDRAVEDISAGRLHRRILVDGSGDAFDRIGHSFNEMLDRIGELVDSVRQVSDHIAHDLRTPLTRLRNRLASARAGLPEGSEAASGLDAALADTDQLLQIFSAILRLSRIEAQAQASDLSPVRLDALARDAVDLYAPIAAERGMRIDMDLKPLSLPGDADQLFQMLVNLIDNALKYGQGGDAVRLLLCQEGEAVRLEVADRGDGIPEAERQRVFDRFHRLDTHRGSEGNGLGLPLARAIVLRHGGQVSLHDNAPGLRVRIDFPVSGGASIA